MPTIQLLWCKEERWVLAGIWSSVILFWRSEQCSIDQINHNHGCTSLDFNNFKSFYFSIDNNCFQRPNMLINFLFFISFFILLYSLLLNLFISAIMRVIFHASLLSTANHVQKINSFLLTMADVRQILWLIEHFKFYVAIWHSLPAVADWILVY